MSIIEVEQRAFSEEPFGSSDTLAGVPIASADICVADTQYADLYAGNPSLAHEIWEETAQDILDSDFDPRAVYLDAFNNSVAARSGEEGLDIPIQPTDEVLVQLGTTSMFVHISREYYRSTQGID
jgi:hypothetical protein